jgi:type IV pilus assembly protein PilF
MRLARPLAMLACFALLSGCVTTNEEGAVLPSSKPDLKEAARLNTQLGVDYMRRGEDQLAMEKLQRALAQDDSLALTHVSLAYLYAKRGEKKEAEQQYRRALALEPENSLAANNFGVFLCSHGEPAEAVKYFVQAARDPDYNAQAAAWTNAGVCSRKLSDSESAEKYLRQALKIDPRFPDALSQMARLAFEKRDYLKARAFLQRYEAVGRPTAETLDIGARTEAALGDQAAARRYRDKLQTLFPDVDESSDEMPSPAS